MWFAGRVRYVPEPGKAATLRLGFSLKPGMRVGLFGGSFNPPHEGHLHVAETARIRLGLDRIVWLVSPQNPLKAAHETAPLEQRMAWTRALAAGPDMIVSDVETRAGVRWTIDTLRLLKARHPGVKFVWVMGSDNLAGFHHWKGWTDIARLMPMAVIARPGSVLGSRFAPTSTFFADRRVPATRAPVLADMEAPAWVYLTAPLHPQSSTAIRRARKA
jgi:nicotinate-nucleotide adenylyltransferase